VVEKNNLENLFNLVEIVVQTKKTAFFRAALNLFFYNFRLKGQNLG